MSTTEADDLVTEEMEERAKRVFGSPNAIEAEQLIDALRAVAPLIAERASAGAQHVRASAVRRADEHARAEEREACAAFAKKFLDECNTVSGDELAAAIRARGGDVTLFRRGEFTSAAGRALDWKIECDALTDEDWACIACVGAKTLQPFGRVIGVPRGGLALASAMRAYVTPGSLTPLVVDDVWTTGKSMCAAAPDGGPWIGFVAFARGPLIRNVTAFATIGAQR